MSYFGETLKRLMELNGVSGPAIETKTGIKKSSVSRWATSQQTFITPEDLALLGSAITRDRREKAELIAAHLRDELHDTGSGSELIDIKIKGRSDEEGVLRETPIPYGVKLSPTDEKMIQELISKIPENPALVKALKYINEAL